MCVCIERDQKLG
uniref:Uncharacterized protein n=1 Tax=Anopheles albimanus TaxID=7167 RepID=A0A182FX36_ANOAL